MPEMFNVEGLDANRWEPITSCRDQSRATDYAKFYERRGRYDRIRVVVETPAGQGTRHRVTYLGDDLTARRRDPGAVAAEETTAVRGHTGTGALTRDIALSVRVLIGTAIVLAVGYGLVAGLDALKTAS